MTRDELLQLLEVERLTPPPPLPPLTVAQGQANLKRLADSMGPKEWRAHLLTMHRERRAAAQH